MILYPYHIHIHGQLNGSHWYICKQSTLKPNRRLEDIIGNFSVSGQVLKVELYLSTVLMLE